VRCELCGDVSATPGWETLRSDHVAEGVHVRRGLGHGHTRTGLSGWLGERLDVGWAMDVLRPRPGSA